jgi:hypothetical protein
MNNYRFKRRYSPARRTVAVFRAAFVIALVSFLFQFAALFFPTGSSLTFQARPLAIAFFVGGLCVVFLLLCANATVWCGMLHFLVTYDGGALDTEKGDGLGSLSERKYKIGVAPSLLKKCEK